MLPFLEGDCDLQALHLSLFLSCCEVSSLTHMGPITIHREPSQCRSRDREHGQTALNPGTNHSAQL